MAVSLKAFFWRSFFRVCSRLFPRPYENTLKRTIFKIVFSQPNGSKMRGNRADPLDHWHDNDQANSLLSDLSFVGFTKIAKRDAEKGIARHDEVLDLCTALLNEQRSFKQNSKDYLKTIDINNSSVEARRLLYEYAAQPFFFDLASRYFETRPVLVELKILVSPAKKSLDLEKSGSQLWHSDFDDVKNLKLFVFLDKVTRENGPLEVLEKEKSSEIMFNVGYRWGVDGFSHQDNLVPEKYSDSCHYMEGEKGDLILADLASCLHRGSRDVQRERLILYANFNSSSSFRFPPFHHLVPGGKAYRGCSNIPLEELDPDLVFLDERAII